MDYDKELEKKYPHSPCLFDRDESDNGYSKGWGCHFKPSELYFVDCHVHADFKIKENITPYLNKYFKEWELKRIKHMGLILPVLLKEEELFGETELFDNLIPYFDQLAGRDDVTIMYWPHYLDTNLDNLKRAYELGARGVKIHNLHIMKDNGDPKIWLTPEWDAMFQFMEEKHMPVLFHVTQRLSNNLYALGGKNTYWKDGWKKGVTFTNEDLTQVCLKLVEKYPNIPFIIAHQMHLGWPRLCELFDKYPNFYIDTSVGCTVIDDDTMYEHDRNYLREVFVKYSDRILFGTDEFVEDKGVPLDNVPTPYFQQWIGMHIRFLRQLNLPYEVMQNIAHSNFERLYDIKPKDVGVE